LYSIKLQYITRTIFFDSGAIYVVYSENECRSYIALVCNLFEFMFSEKAE